MNLVDISIDSGSISRQVVQVVTESLSGSSIVNGGKPRDGFVHEGCIHNAIEGVLMMVGEQVGRCISSKGRLPSWCCSELPFSETWLLQNHRKLHDPSSGWPHQSTIAFD